MKASSGSSCKEGDRAFILRRGMVQFSGVNQVKLYMRLTTVSFYLGLEMCEYDALTVDLFSCGCQLVFYIHHLSIIAFFDEYQDISVSLHEYTRDYVAYKRYSLEYIHEVFLKKRERERCQEELALGEQQTSAYYT